MKVRKPRTSRIIDSAVDLWHDHGQILTTFALIPADNSILITAVFLAFFLFPHFTG